MIGVNTGEDRLTRGEGVWGKAQEEDVSKLRDEM